MSNYVKSTNFASKDSLASGNPLKIVKGAEIDTEFNNIATAVATKADLNSPAFSGTPSLPTDTSAITQTAGDSSTKLSTTAFVTSAIAAALQLIFPVGAIYANASVSTNPATLLGFGTWVAIDPGQSLVGAGTGYAAGTTGGSADATLVSHTHTATFTGSALPGHSHTFSGAVGGGGGSGGGDLNTSFGSTTTSSVSAGTPSGTIAVSTQGSSATGANMPPYRAVYMWRRTA